MLSSLFLDVLQSRLAGSYRRFETTYRSHLQRSTVTNHQSTLHKIAEKLRSHKIYCLCQLDGYFHNTRRSFYISIDYVVSVERKA
jgi:hypothetical protein